ncbi:MAG: MFS transporter [Burkholderiales bacterium]|nr:MFS transporter [Burkholderiales bacterium]
MTTIVVVRKGGRAAIAADTMTKWGSAKETADYVANNGKLLQVGDSWLGLTGNATFKTILRDYFERPKTRARLGTPLGIFRTWQALHATLKNDYHLLPGAHEDEPLESSRFDTLIANPQGIFGVVAHRTVQEFTRYYAFGSGSPYAMGALHALYDTPGLNAETLARRAVEAAAEFDDATGLPLEVRGIRLAPRRGR